MRAQISLLLDRNGTDSLTGQLVTQLRDAIRLGRIAPGSRLPSSRRLSDQLGIGRNTVVRAYETLEMECFVESRPASGMFAALPQTEPRPAPSVASNGEQRPVAQPVAGGQTRGRLSFDFAPDRADAALFPIKTWRRVVNACLSQGGALGLSQPIDPTGLAALRSALVQHLAAARGISAAPGQIIIVSGTVEALALAARLCLTPGSVAVMESPGRQQAAQVFAAAGAGLVGVPVDDAGLVADALPQTSAALLYLTPAHQFPTGHTLSTERRAHVIAWARRAGCVIVEDDCGAAFRYEGGVPLAIAAVAPDCTIHIGDFSQALGAGIRLGYMVVPGPLVDAALAAKAVLNGGSPWQEQAAVAEMMRSGFYVSHLLRMRAAYRERRDHLLEALRRNFGDVEISGEAGGMHLFWQLPPGVPDAATVEALGRRARVGVYSLDANNVFHACPDVLSRRGILLGYAGLAPRQIAQGVARLSDAVDDALDAHRIGLSDLLVHRPAEPRPLTGRAAKPAPRFRQLPALPASASRRAPWRDNRLPGQNTAMPLVTGLYRYPVKGLSPQPVPTVHVQAGKPFPFDRVFAMARPGVAVDPAAPKWAKKGLFVMLMLDEGLARVRTHLDERTCVLTVQEGAETVLSADLNEPACRKRVETFFQHLVPGLRAAPTLVRAREGHFMDKPDNVISLINLATLRALEAQWGYAIDKLRFRANVYIDGAPAWSEFDWIDKDIRIGQAVFAVDRRNGRCGATNVDPATGRRDLDIPGSLRRAFGHKDLGIYLVARSDADVSVGDIVELPGEAPLRATASNTTLPAAGRSFICRGCYFVYQDSAQPVPFADLPPDWPCPDCGTHTGNFTEKLAG